MTIASNEPGRCNACGTVLDSSRLDGLCPVCTWRTLADGATAEREQIVAGRGTGGLFQVADLVVLEELARGGMGIVYRVRQLEPPREVALKMLLPHQLGSAERRERFRLEAQTVARLSHPSILPVYQVGEHDGLPFFTMRLATGGSLAGRLEYYRGHPRQSGELIALVADAVQYAHARGVLHRDLKPGNILFDETGRPFVSDFGLAKLATMDSDLTKSADVLGTPHYMAPEVAARSAAQATTASDIYSLGAILYQLLAGRLPFEAEGMPALLRKVAENEPAPLPAACPRDLAVICLKCLAKEPGRRYGSARELELDLRRWLAGQPILARPVSSFERMGKWVQRNPVLAVLAAALAITVFIGCIAVWRSDRAVRAALRATRQAESLAQGNLRSSLLAEAKALGAARATGQRWLALDALTHAARIQPSLELRNEAAAALAKPDLREIRRFPATIGPAGSSVVFTSNLEHFISAEPTGGFTLRATSDQRVLARFPGSSSKPARWFVLSSDDQQVAAVTADYQLEVWSLTTPERLLRLHGIQQQPPAVDFSPDGLSLAAYEAGQGFFLQPLPNGERHALPSRNARVIFLRFNPKGNQLAAVRDPGGVEVWSCGASPRLLWSRFMTRTVPWLAWSPDGERLVAAADDGRGIRIFSAADGQTELVYSRHLLYPRQFEFDPSGQHLASVGQDWVLRLWDPRTGQDLVTGVGRHRVLRFSRDGRRLTTAPSDRELAVMELAPAGVFREFLTTTVSLGTPPYGLTRTSDGKLLVASYPLVRLYDTQAGKELAVPDLPAFGAARQAFFEPDGSALFYALTDKGLCRRDLSSRTGTAQPPVQLGKAEVIVPTSDRCFWSLVESGNTWVRRNQDNLELWPRQKSGPVCRMVMSNLSATAVVSQDSRWAAASEQDRNQLVIWSLPSGRKATNLLASGPDKVWFSPDSRWLVASVQDGYRTWEVGSWNSGAAWEAHLDSGDPGELSFSDDGRLVAARQERETFRLLSFPDCRELVTLKPPLVVPLRSACLSGDGSRLWLLAGGYRLFEWNLAELRHSLAGVGLAW